MEILTRTTFAQRPGLRSDGHDHDVAILLTDGTTVFECGQAIEVVAPSLYFIPAHAPHGVLEARDGTGWVFAGLPLQIDMRRERLAIPLSHVDAGHLTSLFDAMARESNGTRPYRETAIGALRTLVSVEIARARRMAALPSASSKLADAAMDTIAELAHTPVKPRDVAKALGVTPAHLSHEVSRVTGRTITEWIAEARVTRVKELLLGSKQSLAEVAEQLQYSDVSQLAREFKRVTGMPPGAWRANSAC